jgi:hypothetical protein
MNRIIISFLFLLVVGVAQAQEFKATVKINTPKLQTADPAIFKTLEKAVNQLVTGTAWTENEFEEFEKINVNVTINITEEVSATSFKAELLIQATRPIFNTSQETQLFAISDARVSFSYEQFQPLEFTKNVYSNNLTSIISYYCYLMLGYDHDTFSPSGGTPYYQLAQDVLTNVPPNIVTSDDGWSAAKGNNRNRYWLLENALSPRVSPLRSAFYDYHLRGLDRMTEDVDEARKSIANAIIKVAQVNRSYPSSMMVQLFALAKGDEILQIFIVDNYTVRKKIYDAMIKIDATNASKYEPLLKR